MVMLWWINRSLFNSLLQSMHICKYLEEAEPEIVLVSAELIPPKKGEQWEMVKREVAALQESGVSWVSVTSHSHERSLELSDGRPVVRVRKKRLDTNALCIALKAELGIEVMPHLICHGFTKDETEDALFNLHFLGIENVLLLRGDPLPGQHPTVEEQLHNQYACDLVAQVRQMNHGQYLDVIDNAVPTNFCIGVAGYPEKHHEAADLREDVLRLRDKVDHGANFIITQMFFDNAAYFRFVDEARRLGITAPIIPGIKPVYKKIHLTALPKIFRVSMPPRLIQALEQYDDPADVRKAGTEFTQRQCQELLDAGIPYLHFFTMTSADPTVQIIQSLMPRANMVAT